MNENDVIIGVVLAGGRSSRMGRPKALLRLEGEPFLARCVRALAGGGCGAVLAVVPAGAHGMEAAARAAGATPVPNPDPAAEQIDSLRLALGAVGERAEAVVVTPVDAPRVGGGTVRALIHAFRESGSPVVLPIFDGTRGHPTLFGRSAFPALLSGALPEGARTVIDRYAGELREVKVDDPGVLDDIDTPDELPGED